MLAGQLRHPITVQYLYETPSTSGQLTQSWLNFANVWAAVEPLSAHEIMENQQNKVKISHQITIRYLAGLNTTMRIVYGGRYFDITSVLNFEERNIYQTILATESNKTS